MCLHAPCNGASADGENYQTSACGPFARSLKIKIRSVMRDLIKNALPQKYVASSMRAPGRGLRGVVFFEKLPRQHLQSHPVPGFFSIANPSTGRQSVFSTLLLHASLESPSRSAAPEDGSMVINYFWHYRCTSRLVSFANS